MKWYLNMKIGKKLVVAFVLVALISAALGTYSIYNLKAVERSGTQIYENMTVPLSELGQLSTYFERIRVASRDLMMDNTAEGVQADIDTINDLSKKMDELALSYESTAISDEMKKDIKELIAADDAFNNELNKVITLTKENRDAEAMALLAENGSEGKASRAMQDIIEEMMSEKVKDAQVMSNSNTTQADRTTTIMIIVSVFVFLISILLGIFISSVITKPLKKAAHMIEEMSKGHVQERLHIDTKDEIGQMARSMDFFADELQSKVIGVMNRISAGDITMEIAIVDDKDEIAPALKKTVETIRELNHEVQSLIQAATDGKLDIRGSSDAYSGSWKDMIDGINGLVDAFVAPINMTAEYVERISKGDIPPLITDTYLGDFNEIKNNINNCIAVMSGLIDETGKLIEDAQEGKLDSRGNAAAFSGEWGALITGINSILDSIVKPLKFSVDYIQRMADGQYVEEINDAYKGEYKLLMDAQLSIRDSLNSLVGEIMAITKATDEGDLTVRGDIRKFKGGYQDIIGGFNNILDMVIAPLNEAEQVLRKMSVNDFSSNMTGQYKGTLKDFAGSINGVIERLLSMQDATVRIGNGDTSRLEELLKIGKRSENDQLIPALIFVNQAVNDLIHEVTVLADSVLQGDLSVRADASKFKGGYKDIIEGFNKSIEVMVESVNDTSSIMKELAAGNLDIYMEGDYKGDFARLQDDINITIRSINEVMNDINEASDQVASGSRQVSDGSQALSQGSTEQASSIEELTASIAEIADQTKQNAVNASKANELSTEVMETAMLGNKQMTEMLRSMSEINESSVNISKIIKVIDDIAFQTNILALNAAVEAARAGQHGKGFAVVAEEVRNLAARSADAAKETTGLIEGSVNKVQEGTGIANNTAAALNEIVRGIEKTSGIIAEIAKASNEQASGITQINKGIDQVSLVVQNNSATAEESAAASEELSGQAELLKEMIGKFQLQKSSIKGGEPKLLKGSTEADDKTSAEPQIKLSLNEFDKY